MTSSIKAIFENSAAAFSADADAAQFNVSATNDLVGATEVAVQLGDRTITVDEPVALGGGDAAPNPVQFALAALGSCQAITYRFWSEKMGIEIDRLKVEVNGGLDLRGFLGVEDSVRPGFGDVEIRVEISGPEPPERYEALRKAVDEHCPVLDVFANAVPVHTTLSVG